jgi:hypothetical protein
MSDRDRVRRTVILSLHCLRNIAFYRAGWRANNFRVRRQFWIAANGAFMDSAILEWCKLFADPNGKHRWSRSVDDKAGFAEALYRRLRFTEAQFSAYAKTFKHPRDKFIAHLDEEKLMNIPRVRVARASAAFLHDYLVGGPATSRWFSSTERESARQFYSFWYRKAVSEYRRAAQPAVQT